MIRHSNAAAARHVLNDHRVLARQILFEETGNDSGRGVCNATGPRADKDRDCAIRVEIDVLFSAGDGTRE